MRNILIVLLILICVSCTTTKYVEVPIETIKTEYISKVETKYDSVFIRDSIDRYIKDDTVFLEKYKTVYKYRDKFTTDTIVKTDSIEIPVEVRIETVREVNKVKGYQLLLMYAGVAFLAVMGIYVYKLIRKLFP